MHYQEMDEEILLRHARLGNYDPMAGDANDGHAECEMRRRGYTDAQIEHARQGRKQKARLTKEQKRGLKERMKLHALLDTGVGDLLPREYARGVIKKRTKNAPNLLTAGELVQYSKNKLHKERLIGRKAIEEIAKILAKQKPKLGFRMDVLNWERHF